MPVFILSMEYNKELFGQETIPDELFERMNENALLEKPQDIVETRDNSYCPDCHIPMMLSNTDYQCNDCGRIQPADIITHRDLGDIGNANVRINTGSMRGMFYNTASDYTKTQMRIIMDQLTRNQLMYTNAGGIAFPLNILQAAATQYNNIQKYITEDDIDAEGNVRGQKKFVRRGIIRDETLAALIYYEGVREKVIRKKKDIAAFMNLPTYGFSRGEDIVRNLHAEGNLDIPIDEEPVDGFVDRYMERLGINEPHYAGFVIDLVEESERLKIGMNSQLSSKVVGAIWTLIMACKLGISSAQLEKATDHTKRNTFAKFYNTVNRSGAFGHIFRKWNIPI